MYAAWFKKEDDGGDVRWECVTVDSWCTDEEKLNQMILDHEGEFVTAESEEEDDVSFAIEQIKAIEHGNFCVVCPNRYVYVYDEPYIDGDFSIVSDYHRPLNSDELKDDSIEILRQVKAAGRMLTDSYSGGPTAIPGIVIDKIDDKAYVVYCPERWEKLVKSLDSKNKKKSEEALLGAHNLSEVVYEMAKNIGTNWPKSLTMSESYVWLCAHDKMFGKHKTNKVIRPVSVKCRTQYVHVVRKLRRAMGDDLAQRIIDRLCIAVRYKPTKKELKKLVRPNEDLN